MELEDKTTKAKEVEAKTYSSSGSPSEETSEETSSSEDERPQVAIQTLYSSQEELARGSSNFGSIEHKPIHFLSHIQDAHATRREAITSQGVLDGVNRPERWLLAHSNSPQKETLSRFCIQGSRIFFQRLSLRSQRGTKNVYKDGVSYNSAASPERHLVPSILKTTS